jgi:cell division protein FtsI (penicillin-binding protein 3)
MYTSKLMEVQVAQEAVASIAVNESFENYQTILGHSSQTIPDVKGMSGMDAVALLENLGCEVEVNGHGQVVSQSMNAGVLIEKGTKVALKLSRS